MSYLLSIFGENLLFWEFALLAAILAATVGRSIYMVVKNWGKLFPKTK